MATLESWLKENKLSKILEKLTENDVESLEDIQELEAKEEIESLADDMQLKTMLKKKFVKAVMKLNNIAAVQPGAVSTPQQNNGQTAAQEQKYDAEDEKEMKQPEGAEKPKRKKLNIEGVHAVDKLDELDTSKRHRTIMVIGATGTGKTTLLNSMMNYLWQVEYEDKYRFKLVYEKAKKDGQAESQTDEVTAYHLDAPALDYQLTVIDTPGYGDTRGIAQDQKITKRIKTFFETKIQEIDAICFVIRAPQARLTATQKYIFAQVLGIFGNDIKDNILVLMTFADGKKPPALEALKAGNVPFGQHFKLNNSAFDLPDDDADDDDVIAQMFWKMGVKAFEKLFVAIDQLKPKSLTLTKKVLTRREQLENKVVAIQPTIKNGFSVLERLRKQIVVIEKYGDMINQNKDFTYKETINKSRKDYNNGGKNTTTCLNCNFTCHNGCAFSDNADKKDCCAMDSDGDCTVCRNRCSWDQHKNLPYKFVWYTEEVTQTYADLKSKYVDASNNKSAKEQMMAGTLAELEDVEEQLNGLIGDVKDCLNELAQIALRPNTLSQDDYVDKLIQAEEDAKAPGWKQRIGALRDLKKKKDTINEVASDEYDPWKQYKDVMKYVQKNDNIKKEVQKKKKQRKNKGNKNKNQGKGGGWFSGWSWR